MLKKTMLFAPGTIERCPSRRAVLLVRWVAVALALALGLLPWLAVVLLQGGAA